MLDAKTIIIMPAHNEAENLPMVFEGLRQYAPELDVVVVDDASSDETPAIAAQLGAVVVTLPCNLGYGGAVQTGFKYAVENGYDYAVMMDADGQHDPEFIPSLLSPVLAGEADVAIGSRLVAGGDVTRRRTWTRGLAGRLFARTARRWLRVSVLDSQCGFKMFRREAGRSLFTQSRESGYLFDLELLVLAAVAGYRVVEVPINWADVPGGHLSLGRELGRTLVGLWRLRRRLIAREPSLAEGRGDGDS